MLIITLLFRCGVHISQNTSVPLVFGLNVMVKDSNGEVIGNDSQYVFPLNGFDLASELPYKVVVTPGLKETDPIVLEYAGFSTPTVAPACSVGGYDNGVRQMDCGFPCS